MGDGGEAFAGAEALGQKVRWGCKRADVPEAAVELARAGRSARAIAADLSISRRVAGYAVEVERNGGPSDGGSSPPDEPSGAAITAPSSSFEKTGREHMSESIEAQMRAKTLKGLARRHREQGQGTHVPPTCYANVYSFQGMRDMLMFARKREMSERPKYVGRPRESCAINMMGIPGKRGWNERTARSASDRLSTTCFFTTTMANLWPCSWMTAPWTFIASPAASDC